LKFGVRKILTSVRNDREKRIQNRIREDRGSWRADFYRSTS
jgi:hypothetical protein